MKHRLKHRIVLYVDERIECGMEAIRAMQRLDEHFEIGLLDQVTIPQNGGWPRVTYGQSTAAGPREIDELVTWIIQVESGNMRVGLT
jgi:ribosomal protein S4E